jgi:hypothetical protein
MQIPDISGIGSINDGRAIVTASSLAMTSFTLTDSMSRRFTIQLMKG